MKVPNVNNQISLGIIISVLTIVVAVAVAWGQFGTRLAVNEAAIARLNKEAVDQADFKRLERQINDSSPRLRQVEQSLSAQDATLDRILETLVDIRLRLDRERQNRGD